MLSTISCLVIILSLVASTIRCNGEGFPAAPSCARFECVNYTVIHSQKEFEIRDYNHTKYVYTQEILAKNYREGASKGFLKVLAYVSDSDRHAKHMNMTAPLLVRVENSTYTTYFFLPKQYQTFFISPEKHDLRWDEMPYLHHKYVAVRRFDGMINDETIATNLAALKKSVESTPYASAAKSGASMVAAYNNPRAIINRVNEIWVWFD